jgi:AAA+ superfamily predicted ATPase
MLDQALFRRFDDVLHYSLPTSNEIVVLLQYKLSGSPVTIHITDEIIHIANGLSHAEIARACEDFKKTAILSNGKVDQHTLIRMLSDRVSAYGKEA